MRIAIWHNLPSGGAKRSLYYEVRELMRRGHHVEAWCPPTADSSFLPLRDFVPEHIVPLTVPHGFATRALGPYSAITARLQAMDDHCRRAAAQINAGGFDLLFGQGCMWFRTTPISRYVDLPKTMYLGEPYRWLFEAMPELPWAAPPTWANGWWRPSALRANVRDVSLVAGLRLQLRAELANARAWDTLLANSLYSRESFLRAYGVDAQVRYPGIDTDLFLYRRQQREPFVLGLGAFTREKNVVLAIRALAAVPEPRPRLVWVGNVGADAFVAEMRALAASCGVVFEPLRRIDDDALVDLLNRALALIYVPRLEPFGLAPLEASACGTPVVAVAEGGVRETVLDGVNGLITESTPAALGAAIARLRDDPALARRLGENGHALVQERWSLPASMDRLEGRFAEVLALRGRAA